MGLRLGLDSWLEAWLRCAGSILSHVASAVMGYARGPCVGHVRWGPCGPPEKFSRSWNERLVVEQAALAAAIRGARECALVGLLSSM